MKMRPPLVSGVMSPNPTVVTVTVEKYKLSIHVKSMWSSRWRPLEIKRLRNAGILKKAAAISTG